MLILMTLNLTLTLKNKRLKGVSLLVCPRCPAAPSVTPEAVSRYRARIELSVMDVTPTSALMEWDFTGLDPRYVQLFELKVKSRSNFTLLTESLKPNLNVMDLSLQPGLYDERVYIRNSGFSFFVGWSF